VRDLPQLDFRCCSSRAQAPPTPQPRVRRPRSRAGEDAADRASSTCSAPPIRCLHRSPHPRARTSEPGGQSIRAPSSARRATLYGTVVPHPSTTRDLYEMEVHLIGAAPNLRRALFGNGTCHRTGTGRCDHRRVVDRRHRLPPAARNSRIWESATEVRVPAERRADIVKPLWPSDLGWPAKSRRVSSRARRHREPLARRLSRLAACTVMRVPRVGPEPGEG